MATANLLQTSVSGGTQNALSLQGDGVFFPKASTTSRLALTLTTTDKGFIVYDTTDNNIYFWNGAAWESVPSSGDAGANGSVQYNDAGIVSGATNFVYDKATGNVGIGVVPTAGRLHVKGGVSQSPLALDTLGYNQIVLQVNGANRGQIYADATNCFAVVNSAGSAAPLVVTDTGNVSIANGNLILGTSGKGIDFSATPGTGTSELLNDYEEGTFVPTVGGSTSNGTATYSTQTGVYTKIGRIVQIQIFVAWSAGTATGSQTVLGLPFAAHATANNFSILNTYPIDIALTAGSLATSSISPNGSAIDLYQLPTGGGPNANVPCDAAGSLLFTGTYTAA